MSWFTSKPAAELPTDPARATPWQLFVAEIKLGLLESQFPWIFGKAWPWSKPAE